MTGAPPSLPFWIPDWRKMMAEAPCISVPEGEGHVYLIADAHLGDVLAPTGEFLTMLHTLPQPRLIVFLGDLFKVWLALPKYWDKRMREILDGFSALRGAGVRLLFVVGNREYFLPTDPRTVQKRGLPFDHVVKGACLLQWGPRCWGMTHGDVVNRADFRHLKWRYLSRSRPFEALFRVMPGWLARDIAHRLERAMAGTNQVIKVQYPLAALQDFHREVMGELDGFFLGHFHRDEVITLPGSKAELRIVPDWHSRKIVLRLDENGGITPLSFSKS